MGINCALANASDFIFSTNINLIHKLWNISEQHDEYTLQSFDFAGMSPSIDFFTQVINKRFIGRSMPDNLRSIDDLLRNMVAMSRVESQLRIDDVDAIAASKSMSEFHKYPSPADFGACCDFIKGQSEQDFLNNYQHCFNRSDSGDFYYYSWQDRVVWSNSDGSHHFSRLQWQARNMIDLADRFTIQASLRINRLNIEVLNQIKSQFMLFLTDDRLLWSLVPVLEEYAIDYCTYTRGQHIQGLGNAISNYSRLHGATPSSLIVFPRNDRSRYVKAKDFFESLCLNGRAHNVTDLIDEALLVQQSERVHERLNRFSCRSKPGRFPSLNIR